MRPDSAFCGGSAGRVRLQVGAESGEAAWMQAGQRSCVGRRRLRHSFGAALGDGIKKAHRVQLIAEELGADGLIVRGRKDVENAAAQRELSRALDEARAGIAAAVSCSVSLSRS